MNEAIRNTLLISINKNSGSYVIAGEFMPGEGRLLKFAPVMQEGGTLACDDRISI